VCDISLWRALLGVENIVIEDIEFDGDCGDVVAHVRLCRAGRGRCGGCGLRAPWYDRGEGRRRWRGLDRGVMQVFLEADAPRGELPGSRPDRAAGAVGAPRRGPHAGV
jgi:transposase